MKYEFTITMMGGSYDDLKSELKEYGDIISAERNRDCALFIIDTDEITFHTLLVDFNFERDAKPETYLLTEH